jgi:hypothetical protein
MVRERPVRISSARPLPIAGAVLNDVPLSPVIAYSPPVGRDRADDRT